mgnify:CR=1 FL=1
MDGLTINLLRPINPLPVGNDFDKTFFDIKKTRTNDYKVSMKNVELFKNSINGSIGTTGVVVYEAPIGSSATVIGVNVANANSNNISVSVMMRDISANKVVYVVKDALIVPGSSNVLVGGEQKLVLESGDFLSVTSSLANSADVIVSVLEIT